jgi:SAM-dependent methyltransferase
MSEEFGQAYWEDRYHSHTSVHTREPNPHLVAETGDLAPGRALDAGCGEGADAVWLARHGWRVTAVDISATALSRAREHGENVADQIDWIQADLTGWTPPERHFDLVSAHYVHPAASRRELFRGLAASVVPGGTLLIVDHHPSAATGAHDPLPHVRITAQEIAAWLDQDDWKIIVADSKVRTTQSHGVLHDAVLRARRVHPV